MIGRYEVHYSMLVSGRCHAKPERNVNTDWAARYMCLEGPVRMAVDRRDWDRFAVRVVARAEERVSSGAERATRRVRIHFHGFSRMSIQLT